MWEQQLTKMVDQYHRAVQTTLKALDRHQEMATRYLADAQEDRDKLRTRLERFQSQMAEHLGRRNDPEVLIRNYNETTIRTYHASDGLCGWSNPGRSTKILLSQAKRRGLRPCTSCGYRIKEAEPVELD